LKNFSRIFQKYFWNIFPKDVAKTIKKQMGVARVIPFTPMYIINNDVNYKMALHHIVTL
jgi:hypothetical protein